MSMKKIYVSVLILLNSICAFAQIPNPSFEQWTFSQPDGWRAYFNPPNSPYTFETQDPNAHDGSIAVKSEVILTGPVCNRSGLYTASTNYNFFVPISVKPLELHGWYILNSDSNDHFNAVVEFKNNGTVIGTGTFVDSLSNPAYQEFIVNITYTSILIPDSFSIIITFDYLSPNHSHCGSYFIVDDLSFQNFVGINELAPNYSLKVSPNPFSDKTLLKYNVRDLNKIKTKVIDVFGREVSPRITIKQSEIEIERSNLTDGIYFIELWEDNKLIAKTRLVVM
jgi:hypothetical protein